MKINPDVYNIIICKRKKTYFTYEYAKKDFTSLQIRNENRYGKPDPALQIYYCKRCLGFHIGHKNND